MGTDADVCLEDGLLVHIGHHTTHIMPILDGAADVTRSRRVKIGGLSMTKFLCRWLQLQYPHQTGNITLSRAEELLYSRMRIDCYLSWYTVA
ncbi:Actin family [Trinorchestia longiramus]|nr:Actin family [Trinorchestia longiramus]